MKEGLCSLKMQTAAIIPVIISAIKAYVGEQCQVNMCSIKPNAVLNLFFSLSMFLDQTGHLVLNILSIRACCFLPVFKCM